ncbi:unnamed protein product [Malus baccata var. baccata]
MEKQIEQIALQVSERAPDSAISADSGQPQDRSENTTKLPQKLQSINLPLIDAIKNISYYAKFFKDVCTKKKKLVDFEKVILTEQCSAVLLHKLPPKKKDPRSEGELKSTSSIIQLADRSITYPRGVIEDVIVKVDNLYLPADFMVLDLDEDLTTPIILGRPFLATAQTLIDVEVGTLTFQVEDQTVVFKLFEASIHSGDKQECMRVDVLNGLPHANFVTRSSTGKLPIKTQNNGNVDIMAEGKDFPFKVTKHQLKPCIGKFGASKFLTLKEPVI